MMLAKSAGRAVGRRESARLRLTVTFTLLVTVVGVAIIASIYVTMSVVPDYRLLRSVVQPAEAGPSLRPAVGADGADESGRPASTSDSPIGLVVSGPADVLRLLLTTSVVALVIAIVLGAVISWVVAGRMLRPLDTIAAAARRAATGDLDHRIEHDGPDDEFARLASTFDEMLGRLQQSFEAHRRFAANASHELRTPLATTQAMLDAALAHPDYLDRETLLSRLRETNSRNIDVVEALLILADTTGRCPARERVLLHDVVSSALADAEVAATRHELTIRREVTATAVLGDPALLRILVDNVVSNAIRYNRAGGRVVVTVHPGRLVVENSGPVVGEDDLPRLTEPFFRAAGRLTGTHGLGLALVEAIVEGHGGGLDLRPRQSGGLRVTVDLEAAPPR